MAELPSGNVTLLFSDIEGSTALLSRLGDAYADALDGQRRVLRQAWAEHDGVELGTEGDSFYVVFATAAAAVAAAVQGQRDIAAYPWPKGERVRVRMGIHTGSPRVHDGAYVGMDVHRAARIAGAAHGGQVVLSRETAQRCEGGLPDGVSLRDLGKHRLKDITAGERLLQLVITGLPSDFPALKTLGAATNLPRPSTPLVGRDGDLSELTALLGSPEVRLVTLTGPGGSGKTRLAIAAAELLRERFPDGVYFVPLAAATAGDVMWTSIAEALDVPPEGRVPPGLFDHVADRSALLVLDNLEQVGGADHVVEDLLDHARQVVVLATSRTMLSVAAEYVHRVSPLEVPDDSSVEAVQASSAVQLFAQQAHKVVPSFKVTAANSTDVVTICRRLDGLPLAIELAAARTRLLSPAALLARLDNALDIAAVGQLGPGRHKTLRDTIAWSYDLLTPDLQAFFRRLGVFSGGAGLDAIAAVTASHGHEPGKVDCLGMISDLLDASLVTVSEDAQGEPRVGMLETIRAFAVDRLDDAGELDAARRNHAHHFLRLAEHWSAQLESGGGLEQHLDAADRFELDNDNLREALSWALSPPTAVEPSPDQAPLALKMCAAAMNFWVERGYYDEGRRWIEQALSHAGNHDSVELGQCLHALSHLRKVQGDTRGAHDVALQTVALWRRLQDKDRLAHILSLVAWLNRSLGDSISARQAATEVVALSRETGDMTRLAIGLWHLAGVEADEGDCTRSLELLEVAIHIHEEQHEELLVIDALYTKACILRRMGRSREAYEQMRDLIPDYVRLSSPEMLVTTAEDFGAILADLGDRQHAIQLLGSAEAMRERIGAPREPVQQAEIAEPYTELRSDMTASDWEREYQRGRSMLVEDALMASLASP